MFFEEFELGRVYPVEPITMKKEQMMAFARDYDPLPLHTDEKYAKTTRFGQLIAPGVMTFMLVWSKVLGMHLFDDEMVAGKSTSMEWHKPVYDGDVITGTAQISKLERHSSRNGMVEVTVRVYNQHQELVLTDVTEVIVVCREKIEK